MKVALLGGSFNPIHNWHIEIAEQLVNRKIADEVWLIPCNNHAFGKELISIDHRINMIRLALKNDKIKVMDIEKNRNGKSYTVETLRELRNQYNHEFCLVIGADNLADLNKWHNFEYLKNNVEFIIINRSGYELNNVNDVKVKHILRISSDISSTKVRDNIKETKKTDKLIPAIVADYIKKEGLYI